MRAVANYPLIGGRAGAAAALRAPRPFVPHDARVFGGECAFKKKVRRAQSPNPTENRGRSETVPLAMNHLARILLLFPEQLAGATQEGVRASRRAKVNSR